MPVIELSYSRHQKLIGKVSKKQISDSLPFLGLDIVGSVVALVKQFGSEGLVGLVAVWVLWGIYEKK